MKGISVARSTTPFFANLILSLTLLLSIISVVRASFGHATHQQHTPPNLDKIFASSRFTPEMRTAVKQRIDENAITNILSNAIPMVARPLTNSEKKNAPPPNQHQKKHHGPVKIKGKLKSLGARSSHIPLILDYEMASSRNMNLYEESIVHHILSWLGVFRLGEYSWFLWNTVTGLNEMAMNLSLTAADDYDAFFDIDGVTPLIPWYPSFFKKIACDLDFTQPAPGFDYGTIFEYPDWCVADVQGVALLGNSTSDLQDQLYKMYELVILNNDYKAISFQCAQPEKPDDVIDSNTYKFYCFAYFVKMTDILTASNCLCANSIYDCCPIGYGI